jgi:hypothetical protein
MIKLVDLLFEDKEVSNIDYYQQVLNISNGISPSSRTYFQSVIDSVKRRGNKATPRQYDILERIRKGDFSYHPRN